MQTDEILFRILQAIKDITCMIDTNGKIALSNRLARIHEDMQELEKEIPKPTL